MAYYFLGLGCPRNDACNCRKENHIISNLGFDAILLFVLWLSVNLFCANFTEGWAIYWPFWLMIPIFYLIAGSIEKAIKTFKEYKSGEF